MISVFQRAASQFLGFLLARFNTFNLFSKAVIMSSSNIFCNSVESFLIFSPKTKAILVSNSFLLLKENLWYNYYPPVSMGKIDLTSLTSL